MEIMSLPRIGPYVGVSHDRKTVKTIGGKRRTFRIIIYGAYDALGLIGTECNGVAILDEDEMRVLADELACADSGWFGSSLDQRGLALDLRRMTGKRFRAFVNSSRRNRYAI